DPFAVRRPPRVRCASRVGAKTHLRSGREIANPCLRARPPGRIIARYGVRDMTAVRGNLHVAQATQRGQVGALEPSRILGGEPRGGTRAERDEHCIKERGATHQSPPRPLPLPRPPPGAHAAESAALVGPSFPSTDLASAAGSYTRPAFTTSLGVLV